jgi:RNase P protein component
MNGYRQKFPRWVRILHPQEFKCILNRPVAKATPYFRIKKIPNSLGMARLGVLVPKKKFPGRWKEIS